MSYCTKETDENYRSEYEMIFGHTGPVHTETSPRTLPSCTSTDAMSAAFIEMMRNLIRDWIGGNLASRDGMGEKISAANFQSEEIPSRYFRGAPFFGMKQNRDLCRIRGGEFDSRHELGRVCPFKSGPRTGWGRSGATLGSEGCGNQGAAMVFLSRRRNVLQIEPRRAACFRSIRGHPESAESIERPGAQQSNDDHCNMPFPAESEQLSNGDSFGATVQRCAFPRAC
jgi:hypothetical protein